MSLSSDGTIVAIGANRADKNGSSSGSASVYKYNGSNWYKIIHNIHGRESGDRLGSSISLSRDGTTLAIGAPENNQC